MKGLKYFAIALALVSITFAAEAQGALTKLGFAVDSSGSIDEDTQWPLITGGMKSAFLSVLPVDGTIEITVTRFSTQPGPDATLIVAPTLIDSVAKRQEVADLVGAMGYVGNRTNLAAGLELLTSSIDFTTGDEFIYNVVTDGIPNEPGGDFTNGKAAAVVAQDAAIAAGVDEISAEYVAGPDEGFEFIRDEIVYPQPAQVAPPFPVLPVGFVIPIEEFEDFEDAFTTKLRNIVDPVDDIPEPTSFLVFAGLGLIGIGYRRWRG